MSLERIEKFKEILCDFSGNGKPDDFSDTGGVEREGSLIFGTEMESSETEAIYFIEDKEHAQTREAWYRDRCYRDYGEYRVSASLWMFPYSNGRWKLFVATIPVYTWKKRTTRYDAMTEKQCRNIAKTYVKAMKKEVGDNLAKIVHISVITYEDVENTVFCRLWEKFGRK